MITERKKWIIYIEICLHGLLSLRLAYTTKQTRLEKTKDKKQLTSTKKYKFNTIKSFLMSFKGYDINK